jgi:hypothetical protein
LIVVLSLWIDQAARRYYLHDIGHMSSAHLPLSLNTFPLLSCFHFTSSPRLSEVICMMADKIEFSPAIPLPAVFDVQERIQQLHGYLDS